MSSIKKNFIYNSIYEIIKIIIPFITIPYVSRVLGADGIGVYSYTFSIVNYFVLIAMLGITNYGNRSIAKVRDNRDKLSKTFVSIYSIQAFMTILMMLLYICYLFIFDVNYKIVAIIQGVYLLSTLLDINWFFFGIEKFKITVTRNILIKLLSLVLIFMFVKTKNDVWIYTGILAGSFLVSNMLLVPFLLKEVRFCKVNYKEIKTHIKPILVLFVPVIAVSLYKVMDKIMLGVMSSVNEVGLYEQAEKITTIPTSLITALGIVMMPRISNLVANGEMLLIKKYIKKSIDFMMFLAFPMCIGLILVSDKFVPLFLGADFHKSILLVRYLSIVIVILSFANVIRTQYLLPKEKDKEFTISTLCGAGINLVLNILLIPRLRSVGACIGTIAAELFVLLYQLYIVKDKLPLNEYFKSILPFMIKSVLMGIVIYPIQFLNIGTIYIMFIQIAVGVIVYSLLNVDYIYNLLKGAIKWKFK